MLPFFIVENEKSAQLGASNFETTITKCEKAIHLHSIKRRPVVSANKTRTPKMKAYLSRKEFNPFLKNAWLLMGKAQYQKGDFAAAASTFSYITRLYAAELQASGVLADIDVLLPVPMHWLKRMRRGYNQAEEVARGLGAVTGIPVGDNLVARRGHSTQTHLSQHDRAANISGRFSVVAPDELADLNVMVVDDIITTGATMIEAARALASTAVASLSLLSLGLAHLR